MIEYTKKMHKRIINIETISELLKDVSTLFYGIFGKYNSCYFNMRP